MDRELYDILFSKDLSELDEQKNGQPTDSSEEQNKPVSDNIWDWSNKKW